MAQVLSDDIDYRAYERQTDASVKVRPAALFLDDLIGAFAIDDNAPKHPSISSTKLDGKIHFRPGEVTVWAGYNGHRKSTFLGQVVCDLIHAGQRVLIASPEMAPRDTLARMARQWSGKRYPSPAWLNSFAKATDGRLWLFDHMGRINPGNMIAVARYFSEELQGQHLVIDSMMMVCASEESLDEQKQFTTDLVRLAQETRQHIHLVAHCRKPLDESKAPTKYDIRGSAAISDQAQNIVIVWANKPKEAALAKDPHDGAALTQPDAVVSVEKQRNGEWEGKAQLWFEKASMRFTNERFSDVEPWPLPEGAA